MQYHSDWYHYYYTDTRITFFNHAILHEADSMTTFPSGKKKYQMLISLEFATSRLRLDFDASKEDF